ncbi:MAG: hypothetical protein JEZ04_20020 [Spirochaetales bacterium]|nr:hypothetical protein [Spirochaetales bacterium]
MLIKKSIIAAALFFLLFSAVTFAEEKSSNAPVTGPAEPENTEIILPPMYLEIEDLSVEDINAVIPDEDSIYLSAVEMPLPEPGDMKIPAEVFALSGPGIPDAHVDGETGGRSFFSEGTIGAGTSYNITGDINLYRIGELPDFRLRYYHNGYDGFAGQNTGEGFSYREELIEAEMNYSEEGFSSDFYVENNEIENGLQGLADYFSMTHRLTELEAGLGWMLTDNLELTADVDGSASGMVLSASSPLESSVFTLQPKAGLWVGDENLRVGLDLRYDLEGSFPIAGQAGLAQAAQLLGADLGFNAVLSEEFKFNLEAGVLWKDYTELYFPFALSVSGIIDGNLDYALSGGYEAGRQYYKDLWKDYPFASAPADSAVLEELPLTHGWFGEGSLGWNILENFIVRSSVSFSNLTDALMPGTSTLTGLGSVTTHDRICLDADAEFYFRLSDGFAMTAGWEGQLLDQIDFFLPRHKIYADLELNSDDGNMGLIAGSEFRFYDDSQSWYVNDWLPVLRLEGYLRFSDSFMLSVFAEDLASGLLSSGRNYWNGYFDRGLFLQIKTKISL